MRRTSGEGLSFASPITATIRYGYRYTTPGNDSQTGGEGLNPSLCCPCCCSTTDLLSCHFHFVFFMPVTGSQTRGVLRASTLSSRRPTQLKSPETPHVSTTPKCKQDTEDACLRRRGSRRFRTKPAHCSIHTARQADSSMNSGCLPTLTTMEFAFNHARSSSLFNSFSSVSPCSRRSSWRRH